MAGGAGKAEQKRSPGAARRSLPSSEAVPERIRGRKGWINASDRASTNRANQRSQRDPGMMQGFSVRNELPSWQMRGDIEGSTSRVRAFMGNKVPTHTVTWGM